MPTCRSTCSPAFGPLWALAAVLLAACHASTAIPDPQTNGARFDTYRVYGGTTAPDNAVFNTGTPGLSLGNRVTPSKCYLDQDTVDGPDLPVDADHDWLADACEFKLALAFRPWLHTFEDCQGAEPYWAAKYFRAQTQGVDIVRIGYFLAYYHDCGAPLTPFFGPDKHRGDGEYISVETVYNASTGHWEFYGMGLSHHGDVERFPRPSSEHGSATHFHADRFLTYPDVWVSRGKHANYVSESRCKHADWWSTLLGLLGTDICRTGYGGRLTLFENRNVGAWYSDSVKYPLVGDDSACVIGQGPQAKGNPPRTECFMHSDWRFLGWQGENDHISGASYYQEMTGDRFHLRNGDPGPGPGNPHPPGKPSQH